MLSSSARTDITVGPGGTDQLNALVYDLYGLKGEEGGLVRE